LAHAERFFQFAELSAKPPKRVSLRGGHSFGCGFYGNISGSFCSVQETLQPGDFDLLRCG
jgi:hypothetical protein